MLLFILSQEVNIQSQVLSSVNSSQVSGVQPSSELNSLPTQVTTNANELTPPRDGSGSDTSQPGTINENCAIIVSICIILLTSVYIKM